MKREKRIQEEEAINTSKERKKNIQVGISIGMIMIVLIGVLLPIKYIKHKKNNKDTYIDDKVA